MAVLVGMCNYLANHTHCVSEHHFRLIGRYNLPIKIPVKQIIYSYYTTRRKAWVGRLHVTHLAPVLPPQAGVSPPRARARRQLARAAPAGRRLAPLELERVAAPSPQRPLGSPGAERAKAHDRRRAQRGAPTFENHGRQRHVVREGQACRLVCARTRQRHLSKTVT
eukprot:1185089-Prorocentrum_minimum.AAC.2